MGRALKLAVAMLSMGLSAPVFSAQQTESVRPVDVEINKLDWEGDRLKKAGQYDAAIAVTHKALQLAEGADGANSERVGHFLTRIGSLSLSKGDRISAQAAYKRAFAIFEQKYGQRLPAWSCYIPALLASLSDSLPELDAKIAYYERGVACYEATPKPGNANAVEAAYQLAYYYRYRTERTDLMAKAAPLLDRWILIAVRDLGPDRYEVARLLRGRSAIYAAGGDTTNARALRLRALDVLSRGPGPAKGDKTKLKEEGQVLLSLMDMYRGSNFDEAYVGYQARYAAVLEQTEGPASRLTISAREQLAYLREQFPNWRPPSEAAPAPTPAPVRQAAVPAPVKPSPEPAGTPQARRLTPKDAVLKAPKGYEHIKPAQMYSISIDALGDPRWIVAGSKAEAMQIGNRMYGFYDRFNGCMSHCPDTIALEFGWVAIIQAFRPGNPNLRGDTRKFGVYVAYGATSRQTAIDGALAEYRAKRGSDGPIAQSIRVGLVSALDWPAIEAKFNRTAKVGSIPNMDELNYRTFCDWGNVREPDGRIGPNMNAEPTTGNLDQDPACRNDYRPGEKLPSLVLTTARPAR
ncbi:hypothetical protein JHS3_13160 [Jeongeupia sp. HS-3]|uniref:tetratricopeptide repeat protein n=1 Tax=Jeongeupia sp. HS-3 TaxID=1009682 RepID=UPI0018A41B75|nr:tetratricopeptide repeat protein [Jeongeupia sp. HS-3]BCL75580.1 hypothetical protein JHS3_13160 [Jeongeupia sp. HS-3]